MTTNAVPDELATPKLMAEARKMTRLDDFGEFEVAERLTRLVTSACEHMSFTDEGVAAFRQDLLRQLVNRLRMQRDITLHPEILEEDVSDPIIVLGLARSGTTKMHKLLSAPDTVQKTLMWRLLNPAPFPNAEGVHAERGSEACREDPRIAAAGTSDLVATENATIKAAHRMEAEQVEEEWLLYQLTFDDWIWCALLYNPTFFNAVMSRPSQAAYDFVKTTLQYLQWQDGGRKGRRWVLKSVGYLADMDALNACYPNATYLHTHRDPRSTVPSWAKFVSAIWSARAQPIDPKAVGEEMLHEWSTAMDRYLEARARLKLDERILDVPYESVRKSPMDIARNLYQLAGLPFTPEAEAAMANWHHTNEQYENGKHEYSMAEFGLNEERIDAAFADYISRFIVR